MFQPVPAFAARPIVAQSLKHVANLFLCLQKDPVVAGFLCLERQKTVKRLKMSKRLCLCLQKDPVVADASNKKSSNKEERNINKRLTSVSEGCAFACRKTQSLLASSRLLAVWLLCKLRSTSWLPGSSQRYFAH